MRLKIIYFAIALGLAGQLCGQDIHFSQYENAPVFTNVGQTGLYAGDYRVAAIYRNQWFSVPVPYSTFGVSGEMRLMRDKLERDILAVGLLLTRDVAGDSELSATQAQFSLAYSKQLTTGLFLFGGVYAAVGQRRFSTQRLQFDDQYNGDSFDPSIVSADLANFRNTNFMYFDSGLGLGLRWQQSRRTFCNLSTGISHLNTPMQQFMSGGERLPMRISAQITASAQVNQKSDLLVSTQYQRQSVYQSFMFGAGWRYHLDQSRGREMAIFATLSHRLKDAIVPMLGFNYQGWQLGLSFDINISNFDVATNRNGAVELSLIYVLARVPKLGVVKTCPIL